MDLVQFEEYSQRAKVYYPPKADPKVIRKLVHEREPVNICFERVFDREKLQQELGYSESYYTRHFRMYNQLAPNIGVYTFTPIQSQNRFVDAHVYNAIGYAFDHPGQPDYQVFKRRDWALLGHAYIQILNRVVECARDQKLTEIVWTMVGGGVFANCYPGGRTLFAKEIFAKSFHV